MTDRNFPDLVETFLSGRLSDTEADELLKHLQADKDFSSQLLQQILLEELLRNRTPFPELYRYAAGAPDWTQIDRLIEQENEQLQKAAVAASRQPKSVSKPHRQPIPFQPRKTSPILGIVVLLALVVLPILYVFSTRSASPKQSFGPSADGIIAVLESGQEAQWDIEPTMKNGVAQERDWVRLKGGLAKMKFASRVDLLLEGKTDLQFLSTMKAFCRRGNIGVVVPPTATGFAIATPHVTVIDQGTAFEINVLDRETNIRVLDGNVTLKDAQNREYPLAAGESAVFSLEKGFERRDAIAFSSGLSTPLEASLRSMKEMIASRKLFAQRGFSHAMPDGTMPAFQYAAKSGAHGCMFPVSLTRDRVPVVLSDALLKQATGKTRVNRLTYENLARLDAGKWKGSNFAGLKFLKLDEVLDFFKQNDLQALIEIGSSADLAAVLEVVDKHDMREAVFLKSDSLAVLRDAKRRAPAVGVVFSLDGDLRRLTETDFERKTNELKSIPCSGCFLDTENWKPEALLMLKKHDIPVICGVVDDRQEIGRYFDMGVDIVVTTNPDLFKLSRP